VENNAEEVYDDYGNLIYKNGKAYLKQTDGTQKEFSVSMPE